jgi:hypothetical protein
MRLKEILWIETTPALQECDFCHEGLGISSYGCRNFEYEGNRVLSGKVNLLMACLPCSQMIEAGAWEELTECAFEAFLQRNGTRRKEALPVRMRIDEIHQMFREHMVFVGNS